MAESPSTRRVCSDALLVSITGMHSCVHPSCRLHWKNRLCIGLHLSNQSLLNSVTSMCSNPMALKELVRRLMSNTVSSSYAMTQAFEYLEHPVASLAGNLQRLRPHGLELSSMAFVNVGKRLIESRGEMSLDDAIQQSTQLELMSPDTCGKDRSSINWTSGYLGKTCPYTNNKVPATVVASSLWAAAFRCNFIPFWLHSNTHNVRAARLNYPQHLALHESNAATKMTLLLTKEEQLSLQRLALGNPSAGMMTLEDVGKLLGLSAVKGTSCNGGTKNHFDTLKTLSASGAKGAAQILQFCRIASVSEQIVIYDLGHRTKALQTKAVIKRLLIDELPYASTMTNAQLIELVPEHAKHLHACVECKRVSNAIVSEGGEKWRSGFNEIGVSSSMMATDPDTNVSRLVCAKRCSTSLKSAVACEAEIDSAMVEIMAIEEDMVVKALSKEGGGYSNGVATRLRRDAKKSLEQRECSVACGCDAMINIPLIGKAVRLWNSWYALCSFCGCFMRFHPNHKYEAELCCLRCDHDMLNRNKKATIVPDTTSAPSCRFCGKVREKTRLTRNQLSHDIAFVCSD